MEKGYGGENEKTRSGKRKRNRDEDEAETVTLAAKAESIQDWPAEKKKKKQSKSSEAALEGGNEPSVQENEEVRADAQSEKEKRSRKEPSENAQNFGEEQGESLVGSLKKKKTLKKDREGRREEDEEPTPAAAARPREKTRRQAREEQGSGADAAATEEGEATGTKAVERRKKAEVATTSCVCGGLPGHTTKETLRRDFGECGQISRLSLLSRSVAKITFTEKSGLEAALKYDGKDWGGRTLTVYEVEDAGEEQEEEEEEEEEKLRRDGGKDKEDHNAGLEIFVQGLPATTDQATLRELFEPCGRIGLLTLPTRSTGRCKGFAWITFMTKKGFKKALVRNGSDFGGRILTVEKAGQHLVSRETTDSQGKGKGKGKVQQQASSNLEIFVKNLAFEATEEGLRKHFSKCGEIPRMHIPFKVGKCMGFAWVTFETSEALRRALDCNNEVFQGRRLFVEKSGQHKESKAQEK